MTAATNLELHRDHLEWKTDNAFWRDELAVWQTELKQAGPMLERLPQILREHASKLEVHARSIRFAEQGLDDHECRLVRAAQAATPSKAAPGGEHCVETYDHAQQWEMHESLKRKHHTLLARLSMLMHSLESDR
ncbi:MAG: hypothetical protein K8U03_19265 [Planctomycetia bacterium]|nr:hypothetical protein [Planctomycetia bacterium]